MGFIEELAKSPENSTAVSNVVSSTTTSSSSLFVPPVDWATQAYADVPRGLYSLAPAALQPYLCPNEGMANLTAEVGGWQSSDGGGGSNGFRSDGSRNEGSSDLRDDDNKQKDPSETRKRKFGDILAERKATQDAATAPCNRATAESNATDLKIGLNDWNSSNAASQSMNAALVERNEVINEEQMDEEMRRERRKQCNRESARRSRIRKQKALEEMERKVAQLNSHISVLNVEIERLKLKHSQLLEEKNVQ
ncbi:uncharacterized protein [Typha angustifolia]|uniref:uncharacterized protein n=1 Tax=Typha angustifolia TaxID=59011 RepID=UPI003C2B9B69